MIISIETKTRIEGYIDGIRVATHTSYSIYIHALKSVREMLCKSYDSCCDASSCKRMREMLTKYLYKQHTFTFFRIYKMTPWHSIFTQWLVQVISRRERILLIQFWTKKFNTWNAEQIKWRARKKRTHTRIEIKRFMTSFFRSHYNQRIRDEYVE